jgi:putative ABC transport system permease protein
MQHWAVDDDYCATLGLHIIQGRDFDPARPADQSAVIINEATARHFGWADAIGRQLSRPDFDNPQNILTYTVIGVVRDFHFESLHSSIEPVALYRGDTAEYLVVHLTEEDLPASLATLREIWQRFAPRQPLNYSFLDEHVAGLYTAERQMRQVMGVFTTLALFIAALGLFSLTTAVVEQRTKEMGIRKILGATIPELLALLSRAFLGPVLVAFIIAAPTAWWLMADWLDGFAYRAELNPWIVLLAGWIALVTAMMTISGRTLRVARVQPVDVLRQE